MAEYMGYILFILLPDEHQNYNRLYLRSGNGPQWESTSAQGSIVTSGRPSSYGLWLIPPIYGTLRQYDYGQRRSLCRGKHNYHTITGTMPCDRFIVLLTSVYIPLRRFPQDSSVNICISVIVVLTAVQRPSWWRAFDSCAHICIGPPWRRAYDSCYYICLEAVSTDHHPHDALYTDANITIIRSRTTTTSMQM
jgi:hypothetical protein